MATMQNTELGAIIGKSPGWEIGWVDYPCETVVPIAYRDADGNRLNGKNDYVLRFPNGHCPPSRIWRISLFDTDGFFCENAIGRYGIGNLGNGLLLDASYSLTIYIQHGSPGPLREVVWLPAPLKDFYLALRMYQPDRNDRGGYVIPSVNRAG